MTGMGSLNILMKKNTLSFITKIFFTAFFIGTIIMLFIVYKKIDNNIAFKFLVAYVLFTFLLLIYIPVVTVINSRRLKWPDLRKRLIKFISVLILFGTLNYGLDYFFRPEKIDLFRQFSIAFGSAFGLSFIDVTLLKKDENKYKFK